MVAADVSPRDALWRLVNGFQMSQAIHVVATLGIADGLADGPRSVDDLAEVTGSHPQALYRLLRALASVGILVEANGRFGLTPMGEYLRSDAPGSVHAWAAHLGHPYYWTTWEHLLHSVKTGEPSFVRANGMPAWEYRKAHPETGALFDAMMTELSAAELQTVVQGYDFSGIDMLVDVAGGHGRLLAGLLAANPGLRGILFDQPHVVAGAGPLFERAGVVDRCEIVGGNFFEAVPAGADAYLLKDIIHDWGDPEAVAILRTCRQAMGETSRLLLVERMIGPPNQLDPAKWIDIQMLVVLGGRERTPDEFRALAAEADLRVLAIHPTAGMLHIVECIPA